MAMRRNVVLIILSALLISGTYLETSFNSATANPLLPVYYPKITINADGSITPLTNIISHNGTIYTLTTNLIEDYSIDILCSNIIFDGTGHAINVTNRDNSALFLQKVTNVTVKNLEVNSRHNSMLFIQSSNVSVMGVKSYDNYIFFDKCNFNTVTKSNIKIGFLYSNNNRIVSNNITGLTVDFCSENNFWENNILCSYTPNPYSASKDRWDNGSIGNYWVDYQSKYPNATQIGNTGIGNKTYVIDDNNKDNYPLFYPFDIEKGLIALPQQTNNQKVEPSLIVAIIGVTSIIAIIGLSIGLLFRKHRPTANLKV